MGIWDRLGNVIKSYLDDDDAKIFGNGKSYSSSADPDLNAAFEELDDYLNRNGAGGEPLGGGGTGQNRRHGEYVPEELGPDFAELGLPFGAPAEACKAAYKKLLKIHHPDRHAGHQGNFKKATEKTARINAAYDRIEKWRS
jgi:DnaJ-domain-containing protein 1